MNDCRRCMQAVLPTSSLVVVLVQGLWLARAVVLAAAHCRLSWLPRIAGSVVLWQGRTHNPARLVRCLHDYG